MVEKLFNTHLVLLRLWEQEWLKHLGSMALSPAPRKYFR